MRYPIFTLLVLLFGRFPLLGEVSGGTLTEKIACASNPQYSYALFLPESHEADHPAPVLVVMDPRGRALPALERFRQGAAELGWVVASSWNTQSDKADHPNGQIFAALMMDLQARVHVHPRRLYLTGFSGLAVNLFAFAPHMPTTLAGIIPVSGGPRNLGIEDEVTYDIYGFAGTRDFNYQEMRELERDLEKRKLPHRVVFFDGRHQWPPVEDAAEALRWLELRAMARGLRPQDDAWIEERWLKAKAQAKSTHDAGKELEALLAFRALSLDFAPFRDVGTARSRWKELAKSKTVKQWTKAERRRASGERNFRKDLFGHLALIVQQRPTPTLRESMRALRVAALLKKAESEDPWEAAAAQRRLSHIVTHGGFYQPRALLDQGKAGPALAMTRLALEVWGQNGGARWFEARALAQLGRPEDAVLALGKVLQLEGRFGVEAARNEEDFVSLTERIDYRALEESLTRDP